MDLDGTGKVSVENIKDLMREAGEEVTEAELTEMFEFADITGDGMVTYEEFERVVRLHEAEQHTMRELFDALDVSGTGVITADDLTAFLKMNGPHSSHQPTIQNTHPRIIVLAETLNARLVWNRGHASGCLRPYAPGQHLTGEAPERVIAMIEAAHMQQDRVVSFDEFVPMVRSQLGAVAPTTGWGQQSEADVLAQLLEHPAATAKYDTHLLAVALLALPALQHSLGFRRSFHCRL